MSRDLALALRAPLRALGRRRGRGRRRGVLGAHTRRRLTAAVLLATLLGAGWLWLRDSSLVAVSDVTITGLTGSDAPAIRRALTDAAHDMTTLHSRPDALRTAVSPYPVVKSIRVETDFPHEMRIVVIEHHAVAAVDIDGARVPVAADGTLLRGRPAGTQLVTLSVPSANGGGRLTSARGRAAMAVMGAAPQALRSYVQDITFGTDGMRVALRNGPLLQFGDAARARAKWLAAARVLGDPRAAGASYVDLRAPERPVAGRFEDPASAAALDGASTVDGGTTSGGGSTTADGTDGTTSTDGGAPIDGTAPTDATSTDASTASADQQSSTGAGSTGDSSQSQSGIEGQ